MKRNRGLSNKANVRDSFSEIELALTNLGEITAIKNTKKQIETKLNKK